MDKFGAHGARGKVWTGWELYAASTRLRQLIAIANEQLSELALSSELLFGKTDEQVFSFNSVQSQEQIGDIAEALRRFSY